MTMRYKVVTLILVLFSTTGSAVTTRRLHPLNICASLLATLRTYPPFTQKVREERDIAVGTLRSFRLGTLDTLKVEPGGEPISIDSDDRLSKRKRDILAKRIRGIELNALYDGAQTEKRAWTYVKEYRGIDEIKNYVAEMDQTLDYVIDLTAATKKPWFEFTLRKRLMFAAIVTANLPFVPFYFKVGLPVLGGVITALGFHAEPLSVLRFLTKEDKFYDQNRDKILNFIARADSQTLSPSFWSYAVNSYAVKREVFQGALGDHSTGADFGQSLNIQSIHETRGLWAKLILEYPALIKTAIETPGDFKDKIEIFKNGQDGWKPFYVHYDRLMFTDQNTGEPLLIVAIRTSTDRSPAKEAVTARANARNFKATQPIKSLAE